MRRFFVCQKSSLWQRLISFDILDILQTDLFKKTFKDCNEVHEISNADFCSRLAGAHKYGLLRLVN